MQNPIVKIIGGLAGLVLVVVGIMKAVQGVKEIAGTGDTTTKQVNELIVKGNALVDEANKATLEGAPAFQALATDIDSIGIVEARKKNKEAVTKSAALFGQSAEKFRAAGAAFLEGAKLPVAKELVQYLTLKAQAYEKYATAKAATQDMIKLALDESMTDTDAFNKSAEPLGETIAGESAKGDEFAAEADKLPAQHPEIFNPK